MSEHTSYNDFYLPASQMVSHIHFYTWLGRIYEFLERALNPERMQNYFFVNFRQKKKTSKNVNLFNKKIEKLKATALLTLFMVSSAGSIGGGDSGQ